MHISMNSYNTVKLKLIVLHLFQDDLIDYSSQEKLKREKIAQINKPSVTTTGCRFS